MKKKNQVYNTTSLRSKKGEEDPPLILKCNLQKSFVRRRRFGRESEGGGDGDAMLEENLEDGKMSLAVWRIII